MTVRCTDEVRLWAHREGSEAGRERLHVGLAVRQISGLVDFATTRTQQPTGIHCSASRWGHLSRRVVESDGDHGRSVELGEFDGGWIGIAISCGTAMGDEGSPRPRELEPGGIPDG